MDQRDASDPIQEKESNASISIKDRIQKSSETTIFENKDLLDPKTIIGTDRIVGRSDQLKKTSDHLAPITQGQRAQDLLLHGPSGTGKSLIMGAVTEQVKNICETKDISFTSIRVNCRTIKSYDKVIQKIGKKIKQESSLDLSIPSRGVATSTKLDRTYEMINNDFDSVVIMLDEIDQLTGGLNWSKEVPAYSELIYELSRATQQGLEANLSLTTITNDPSFVDRLDGRTYSSFHPNRIVFPDYKAEQLRKILKNRKDAYKDGVVNRAILQLTAALAANDHGDARRAIDLFRTAGEIAQRNGEEMIEESHIREAQSVEEENAQLQQMSKLSPNKKYTMYSIAAIIEFGKNGIDEAPLPIAYSVYRFITTQLDLNPKSNKTFYRYVKELETYKMITSTKESTSDQGVIKSVSVERNTANVIDVLNSSIPKPIKEEEAHIKTIVKEQISGSDIIG